MQAESFNIKEFSNSSQRTCQIIDAKISNFIPENLIEIENWNKFNSSIICFKNSILLIFRI